MLLGFVALMVACNQDSETSRLVVKLVDNPADYKEVNVDIQGISVHTNGEAEETDAGWVDLEGSDVGVKNLLDFTMGHSNLVLFVNGQSRIYTMAKGRWAAHLEFHNLETEHLFLCINQILIQNILEQANFGVLIARNGKEAVDLALSQSPDFILMDIQMPELNGYEATQMIRKFDFKVFYGDAARLDLLEAAGAKHARLLIVAVDDREAANRIVEMARTQFPNLTILTRAWDLVHNCELLRLGVQEVERETFEGALKLGEQALKRLGMGAWKAKQAANVFRAHDEQLSDEIYKHFEEDLAVRAAIVSTRRENFRKQMEADDAAFEQGGSRDW